MIVVILSFGSSCPRRVGRTIVWINYCDVPMYRVPPVIALKKSAESDAKVSGLGEASLG